MGPSRWCDKTAAGPLVVMIDKWTDSPLFFLLKECQSSVVIQKERKISQNVNWLSVYWATFQYILYIISAPFYINVIVGRCGILLLSHGDWNVQFVLLQIYVNANKEKKNSWINHWKRTIRKIIIAVVYVWHPCYVDFVKSRNTLKTRCVQDPPQT